MNVGTTQATAGASGLKSLGMARLWKLTYPPLPLQKRERQRWGTPGCIPAPPTAGRAGTPILPLGDSTRAGAPAPHVEQQIPRG